MADRGNLGKFGEKLRDPRVAIPTGAVVLTGATAGVLGFFLEQWVYVVVALLIVLVGLLAYLIWALYTKEREERVVHGTGAGDATIQRPDDRRRAATLEEGFRRAIEVIEARGLQSLPWYLVLGAPGAGKTALLRASGLDVPPAVERLVEAGPTASCNWWLTNQAVLIDPAGRVGSGSEGTDYKEWRQLLGLVRKHRPRPALQGVLVVLSAPDLVSQRTRQVEAHASDLRRHLNEVVDQLGVDPPVYLLVSQADRLPGFVELASGVTRERLNEAFGWTHRERHPHDASRSVRDAIERMRARVEAMLAELLVREPDTQRRQNLFLLPHELAALARAASAFAGRAFQPTRYDDVPFLRGLYLTSALRDGTTVSSVFERLGQARAAAPVDASGPPGGWFLRDFFRRLLLDSEEQGLVVPTDRVGPRTRAVLVGLATAAALVMAGLWGVSFWNNWGTIAAIRDAARDTADQQRSLDALDRLRSAVVEGEAKRGARLHGLGLGGGLDRALDRGRRGFIATFGDEFEARAKAALQGTVRGGEGEAFAALQDLAADVNFLASRGEDAGATQPSIERYSEVRRNEVDRATFRAGYAAFVGWAPAQEIQLRIDSERRLLEEQAPHLLEIKRLEAWCRAHPEEAPSVSYASVRLPDPTPEAAPEVADRVSGCYTRRFYEERLANLMASLERSGGLAGESVDRFRNEYARHYGKQWQDFLIDAPRPAAADPNVRGSPFLSLVATIDENTRIESLWRGKPPVWIRALHEARREDRAEEEKPAPWERYEEALDAVASSVDNVGGRSKQARAVAEDGENSFKQAIDLVRRDLVPIDPQREEEDQPARLALRHILVMPVLNGFSAVLETAALDINEVWRSQVVAPFPTPLTADQYAARKIAITQFKTQTLAPFWGGCGPRPLLEDRALRVSDSFVIAVGGKPECNAHRVGGSSQKAEVITLPVGPQTVRLVGAPSEVLSGGQVFVVSQDLTLTCGSQPPQRFEYSDGVGEKAFIWRPECDYVQLVVRVRSAGGEEIEIPSEWSGPFAFADFLEAGSPAAGGTRQWTVADPAGAGVRVAVRYRQMGGEEVLEHKRALTSSLPGSAVR